MELKIYTPASIPTIAELGEATQVSHSEPCPACNRQPPPRFTFVEFVFDVWDGEDVVTAMDVWAASERLRTASGQASLTGAQFDHMKVTKGEYFELGDDAYAPDLPRFHRVDIAGRARGPETWWISEDCDQCGLRSWERTSAGTRAEIALAFGEPAPPRQVYRGTWNGDDFFRLDDPGPPLVTERVKDVFEGFPVKEVSFQPAEWVDE